MSDKLSAAQRSKIRRLSQPKELAPDEEGGELNIVPFLDIIMNILIFVLATVAVVFTASIETTPPSKGGGVRAEANKDTPTLNLTVFIVSDGFALKATGGNIAPGCGGVGQGIAIPKTGGAYDYAALTACAEKLKGANAAFAEENQASITANMDIAYEHVVGVMDALRSNSQGDALFEEITFKVAK